VGGHPMAGIQFSGIKHSRADLFVGASMIVVPPSNDDIRLFERIKNVFMPLGFSKITVTDAKTHDEIIAYTSQLAHIVSNAYIKSESAAVHHGFSAGSYKDMTRVATLNENMWTQLFMENRQNLSNELSKLILSLEKYKVALDNDDADMMRELLKEGRECKERADG
jgi:prephenate dehydrogenase